MSIYVRYVPNCQCCRRLVLQLMTTTRASTSIVSRMIPPPNPSMRSHFLIEVDSRCRHCLFMSIVQFYYFSFEACQIGFGGTTGSRGLGWLKMRGILLELEHGAEGRGTHFLFLFFFCLVPLLFCFANGYIGGDSFLRDFDLNI